MAVVQLQNRGRISLKERAEKPRTGIAQSKEIEKVHTKTQKATQAQLYPGLRKWASLGETLPQVSPMKIQNPLNVRQ